MQTIHSVNILQLCVVQLVHAANLHDACIQTRNRYVETLQLGKLLTVVPYAVSLRKIHHKTFGFRWDFPEHVSNFGFVPRTHDNVEALLRQLPAHLETYSITATSD